MIEQLLKESNQTANIEQGRPALVGLNRKVNELIFNDIVSIQPTKQPIATVYGVRYEAVSEDRQTAHEIQSSRRTFTGENPLGTDYGAPTAGMNPSDRFTLEDYHFEVIVAGDYDAITDTKAALALVFSGEIRLITDGSLDDSADHIVQESRFIMDHWKAPIRTRRAKTAITLELLRDMEAQSLEGEATVEDLLATTISEEINSDLIMKTIAVSQKFGDLDVSNVAENVYYQGRAIINKALELGADIYRNTTFPPTFLLASPRVASAIRASGMVDNENLIEGTGLKLVTDGKSEIEYMLVGSKLEYTGLDTVSPIYYSPFESQDNIRYLITTDSLNLQPVVGLVNRYAVTASPMHTGNEHNGPQDGENWVEICNKSPLASLMTVTLNPSE